MFYSQKDEEELGRVTTALVEEYGPEYITLSLPRAWDDGVTNRVGCVRLFWHTVDTAEIEVRFHGNHIKYAMRVIVAPPAVICLRCKGDIESCGCYIFIAAGFDPNG